MGACFFLSDYQLHSMIFVNLFFIATSLYVLRWSFNNNLYDSDILMQCQPRFTVFSTIIYSMYMSLKIFVFYFILNGSNYLFDIIETATEDSSNTIFGVFTTLLIFLAVCMVLMMTFVNYIGTIKEKINYQHLKERSEFINNLKLKDDETFFCMDKDKLTGFVSSGKLYAIDRGLICKDVILDYQKIVNYLKETGIVFSELDDDHIEVIKMYNI
jgi:hypothetical protein